MHNFLDLRTPNQSARQNGVCQRTGYRCELSAAKEASPTTVFRLQRTQSYFSKVVVSICYCSIFFFLNPYLKFFLNIQLHSICPDSEPQNLFSSTFLQDFANITWQNVAFFLTYEIFLPGFNFAMASRSVLDSDTSYRSKTLKNIGNRL